MDGALITDHDQSALNRHDLRRKRRQRGEREGGKDDLVTQNTDGVSNFH